MKAPLHVVTVLAILLIAPATHSASAQVTAEFRNSKIVVQENERGDRGYWTTTSKWFPDPAASGKFLRKAMDANRDYIRKRMMSRRVLEEFAEFLSPLRLPYSLQLFASDCDGNRWDSPHYMPPWHAIDMCYSFSGAAETDLKDLVANHGSDKWWSPAPFEQLMAGMYAAVLLHETGHAVFDLMDIPIFGRQEDAADQIAAFVALQFGRDNARTIIKGFASFWGYDAFVSRADPGRSVEAGNLNYRDCSREAMDPFRDQFCRYSDTHGTASQRYYNTLCIALGSEHREWFSDFIDANLVPAERLKNCSAEYKQVQIAFRKTLLPFIDPVQQQKVMKRTWFTAGEIKDR